MENPNLPEEILIEIFSRLPSKFVGKCRCLSKSWRQNLSSSQFIKFHLSRRTEQKYFISVSHQHCSPYIARTPVDENDTVVSRKLDFPDIYIKAVGTCNGLVLLLCWGDHVFSVMNPLTMQEVLISNPYLQEHVSYGFGYDISCDDYKIVKLYNKVVLTFVDVYSMRNRVWKQYSNCPFDGVIRGEDGDGAFLNGAIHWLAEVKDSGSGYVIAAFDLASESFRRIPAPNVMLDNLALSCVFATGGCLCMIVEDTCRTIDVWFMKEYGVVSSWTKFQLSGAEFDMWGNVKPMCFIAEDQVVFLNDMGSSFAGNLTEGTTTDMVIDVDNGYTLVDSLVSPRQLHL